MKTKPAPSFDFVYAQRVFSRKVRVKKDPRLLVDTLLDLKAGKRIKSNFPTPELIPHLVSAVEAALDVAHSFGLNLQYELPRHFPRKCGYCDKKPCGCNLLKVKPERLILEFPPNWWREPSVDQFQTMMFEIYPRGQTRIDLLEMGLHFEDELKELCRELNRPAVNLPKLIAETVDFLEKPLDLASILGIRLAPFLQEKLHSKKPRRKRTAAP